MRSWFFYSQPLNGRPRHKKGQVLFQCYEQFHYLCTRGLSRKISEENKACQELARAIITESCYCRSIGNIRGIQLNCEFYAEDLLENESNKDKEVFVLRAEECKNDLNIINRLVGWRGKITPKHFDSRGANQALRVSNRHLSPKGRKNACSFLRAEIQICKKLLRRAVNLSEEDAKKSLDYLVESCPAEAKTGTCSQLSYQSNEKRGICAKWEREGFR